MVCLVPWCPLDTAQVSSVVLHWGEDSARGSEHTVQGRAAAAEVTPGNKPPNHDCLFKFKFKFK